MNPLERQEIEDRINARKKIINFYDGLAKILANWTCPAKAANILLSEKEASQARRMWMETYNNVCAMRDCAISYQHEDIDKL